MRETVSDHDEINGGIQEDEREMIFNLSKRQYYSQDLKERSELLVPYGSFSLATEKTLNPHNRRKAYKVSQTLANYTKNRSELTQNLTGNQKMNRPRRNSDMELI